MFCLNFCELVPPNSNLVDVFNDAISNLCNPNITDQPARLYFGSSFCQNYFMSIDYWRLAESFCKENVLPITLTVPIFSEKMLDDGKHRINSILQQNSQIDEITINDLGMFLFVSQNFPEKKINLGRLFFKHSRDIRVDRFFYDNYEPEYIIDEYSDFDVFGIELDPTHKHLNLNCLKNKKYNVGMHFPFCYMSTGNICKYASINLDVKHKFRPNMPCSVNCMHIAEHHYSEDNKDKSVYRFGRTLYFLNRDIDSLDLCDRIIYFPIYELNLHGEKL